MKRLRFRIAVGIVSLLSLLLPGAAPGSTRPTVRRQTRDHIAPLLDWNFADRVTPIKGIGDHTFTRASGALLYPRPNHNPPFLLANNAPVISAMGPSFLLGRWIQGADTNVIIRNHYPDYLTGDWTKTNITDTEVATPDLYNGGSIRLVTGGAAGQLTQQQTLTQAIYIAQALVYTDGTAVTSADMEMYASGEIITNPGFEVNTTEWSMGGSGGGTGSGVRDVGTTHGASAGSLKLTHSNAAGYYRANQEVQLISGRTYDLSTWVYVPSADVPADYVQLWLFGFTNAGGAAANLGITDAWQQLTISNWDPGADALGKVYLRLSDVGGAGGAFVYFDDVSVTEVNSNLPTTFEAVGNGVYNAWSIFTGGANAFDLGLEVKANKTVYETVVTVYTASPTNEGGFFPRSHIPNTTAASITRATDVCTIAEDNNVGLSEGMIDVEFIAPCSEAEAGNTLMVCAIHVNDLHNIQIRIDAATNTLYCRHRAGAGAGLIVSAATGFSRGDLIKVRFCYSTTTVDGANYLIAYYRINNGAWTSLGVNAAALGGNLATGGTIHVGHYSGNILHLGSFVRRLRIYDRAILNPSW